MAPRHKLSPVLFQTSTEKSDRSWTGNGRSKTGSREHLRVPADLKKLLLDLTTGYLMEGASDLVDYGVEFFGRLKKCRAAGPDGCTGDSGTWPERSDCGRQVLSSGSVDDEDDDGSGPVRTFAKSDEVRRALAASVRDVLVFRSLDAEQTAAVIDAMFEREVRADDVVIRQGDEAGNFYVVERGTYEARIADRDGRPDRVVRTYEGAGSFGELALLYNAPRAATVVAKTDGVLWVVDRRTFGRVVRRTACDRRDLFDRLIGSVPMLDALQPYERMNLSDALEPRYYRHGELVVGQGDPGDGMYFVTRGSVAVHVTDRTGARARVNTVGEGGYFGELALITDSGRAASVYAVGDVKLAFLDVGAFERLLGPCLDIMKRNTEHYERQLAAAFGPDRVP